MVSKKRLDVLRSRKDFEVLRVSGRRFYPNQWLIINYRSNDRGVLRCGWTISRAVGNAVLRNKLKRWCRAALKKKIQEVPLSPESGIDLNIIFKRMSDTFYKSVEYRDFEVGIEKWIAHIKK